MIQEGFLYIAALVFIAAILINLPKIFTGSGAQRFFDFAPPIVLIYLGLMILCTVRLWDLEATAETYTALKNPRPIEIVAQKNPISIFGPSLMIFFRSQRSSMMKSIA